MSCLAPSLKEYPGWCKPVRPVHGPELHRGGHKAPCRAAHLERQHSARAAAGSPFATAVGPALRAQARPPASPSGARWQDWSACWQVGRVYPVDGKHDPLVQQQRQPPPPAEQQEHDSWLQTWDQVPAFQRQHGRPRRRGPAAAWRGATGIAVHRAATAQGGVPVSGGKESPSGCSGLGLVGHQVSGLPSPGSSGGRMCRRSTRSTAGGPARRRGGVVLSCQAKRQSANG